MKGKHFKRFCWTTRKIISAILSGALLLAMIGFASFAWLTSKHEPVVNKFTGSKLEITLTPNEDQGPYKLVPGVTYELTENAPLVKVVKGSVECYLFVVVHKTDLIQNTEKTYFGSSLSGDVWDFGTIPYGLEEVDNCTRSTVIVPKNEELGLGIVASNPTEDQEFQALNSITVKESLTKAQVNPAYFVTGGGTQPIPKISIDAYAIQTLGIKGTNKTGTSDENEKADLLLAWNYVETAIKNKNTKEVVLN